MMEIEEAVRVLAHVFRQASSVEVKKEPSDDHALPAIRFLNFTEAAELVGVSAKTIRKWTTHYGLKDHGAGRVHRVLLSELLAFNAHARARAQQDADPAELAANIMTKRKGSA